jgi:phosphoglycolate phosphatase-like HAD superfamily hydrolase
MGNAGLREFFTFGAFGDESGRRADLPPLAVARSGRSPDPARVYVIGDTPLDVACGHACQLTTVAIATGRYSLAELQACEPTLACSNLGDFMDALRAGDV